MTSDPTKPDEALIQAYLDDELTRDDRDLVDTRLGEQPSWVAALAELEDAAALLSRGLNTQDVAPPSQQPPPWIDVLKRGAGRTAPSRFPLARAATVTLLLAGAVASGLPGSPVREWFSGRTGAVESTASEAPGVGTGPDDEIAVGEVGVRVATPGGALYVNLPMLPSDTELWVQINGVEGVGVFGPTGTRFRTQDGRVDVLNPQGTVRVELPAALREYTILVGDVVYIRKAGDQVDVVGPVTARSDTEIRFGPNPRP